MLHACSVFMGHNDNRKKEHSISLISVEVTVCVCPSVFGLKPDYRKFKASSSPPELLFQQW